MFKRHRALRTPVERLPSGAPKEEFGRMIFQKSLPLGTVLQPVLWKMRLEMVTGMQNEILIGIKKLPF